MSILLWVDLETTGLNPDVEKILEVAAVFTDYDLISLMQYQVVIKRSEQVLDAMDDWCKTTHRKSGLWDEVLKSEVRLADVEWALCSLVDQYSEHGKPVLAGSSVHFDRSFLQHMPSLLEKIHYRNLDVTSVKLLARAWYPHVELPPKREVHRALPDILESIELLGFLRKHVFR